MLVGVGIFGAFIPWALDCFSLLISIGIDFFSVSFFSFFTGASFFFRYRGSCCASLLVLYSYWYSSTGTDIYYLLYYSK